MISTIDKDRRYDSAPSFNSAAFKCRPAYSSQKMANPAPVPESVKTAKQVKVHLEKGVAVQIDTGLAWDTSGKSIL